jgi:hypothetical protein
MNFGPRKDISEGESVMVKYVCCVLGRYKQLQDLTGSKNVKEVWMKGPGGGGVFVAFFPERGYSISPE